MHISLWLPIFRLAGIASIAGELSLSGQGPQQSRWKSMAPIGSQDCEDVATSNRYSLQLIDTRYIRPKLVENTGSRPLSHSQAAKRWISSWVGDDQRIPGVVCSFCSFCFLLVALQCCFVSIIW